MVDSGFSELTLDLISSPTYQLPVFVDGVEYYNYFTHHLWEVLAKGLSLYIHSRERGRGKTTLAHYLVYQIAHLCMHTANYVRSRTFGFDHIDDVLDRFVDRKAKYLDSITCPTIYVLDDVGNEDSTNKWKRDLMISALQKILHYRRDRNLPTIITSNYTPADLSIYYGGALDSLLEIRPGGKIGGALFREIELGGGEDLRLVEEHSAWPCK